MARLEEWKPTVCEEADGNAGLDRLQLASKRHLQRVSKSGLLKKFLVEEQNGISIKWDFLNFVIFIEQNGIPFVREGTVPRRAGIGNYDQCHVCDHWAESGGYIPLMP